MTLEELKAVIDETENVYPAEESGPYLACVEALENALKVMEEMAKALDPCETNQIWVNAVDNEGVSKALESYKQFKQNVEGDNG